MFKRGYSNYVAANEGHLAWWHVPCTAQCQTSSCEILRFKQITLFFPTTVSSIVPSIYLYPTAETVIVNGSSQNGRCSSTSRYNDSYSICENTTSSVLFDGNIPTLTGLNGTKWASQLFTLQIRNLSGIEIISDFKGAFGVERVELVIFNCPEWGIAVQAIGIWRVSSISGISREQAGAIRPTITSCNSLVRVCTSVATAQQDVLNLQFIPANGSNRIHLAEVRFYGDSATCRQDAIITTPLRPDNITPPPPDTTIPPPPDTITPDTTTPPPPDTAPPPDTTQKIAVVCPSCSTSTVLASVITVIATALLATVISVLVMITVFKCHQKFTPGGAERATSVGGEGKEYEEVVGGKGDVAVSDPTYMEVGERKGGNSFQLRENEAYASTIRM